MLVNSCLYKTHHLSHCRCFKWYTHTSKKQQTKANLKTEQAHKVIRNAFENGQRATRKPDRKKKKNLLERSITRSWTSDSPIWQIVNCWTLCRVFRYHSDGKSKRLWRKRHLIAQARASEAGSATLNQGPIVLGTIREHLPAFGQQKPHLSTGGSNPSHQNTQHTPKRKKKKKPTGTCWKTVLVWRV